MLVFELNKKQLVFLISILCYVFLKVTIFIFLRINIFGMSRGVKSLYARTRIQVFSILRENRFQPVTDGLVSKSARGIDTVQVSVHVVSQILWSSYVFQQWINLVIEKDRKSDNAIFYYFSLPCDFWQIIDFQSLVSSLLAPITTQHFYWDNLVATC